MASSKALGSFGVQHQNVSFFSSDYRELQTVHEGHPTKTGSCFGSNKRKCSVVPDDLESGYVCVVVPLFVVVGCLLEEPLAELSRCHCQEASSTKQKDRGPIEVKKE